MAAPKYKFMTLGKSKFVHAVRTKTADLKPAASNGSQCQTVRKYWVADKIDPKHKGMSPEAASALDPCPNCDTAGVLASMVTPEQKRAKAKEKSDDLRDRIREESKPKGKKPKKPPTGPDRSTRRSGGGSKRLAVSRAGMSKDDVMMAKVNAYIAFGDEHGWDSTIEDGEPGVMVLSTRDNELIRCYFIDGKYDISRHATVEVGSWTGKLRGVHGCRKQMANEGRDRPHPEPGKGRGGPRRSKSKDDHADEESPEDAKAKVPFNVEDDEDADIINSIAGHSIRWRNGVSGTLEEARLPLKPNGKKRDKITITQHPKTARRMVNFLSVEAISEDGEQYGPERTVYLDKIVKVI